MMRQKGEMIGKLGEAENLGRIQREIKGLGEIGDEISGAEGLTSEKRTERAKGRHEAWRNLPRI